MKHSVEAILLAASMLAASIAQGQQTKAPLPDLLPENSFVSFTKERMKVSAYLGCTNPRINEGSKDYGALYSCIGGKAETVKFFVNERPNSGGKVKNVKFLWNDYTKDLGYGLHADAAVAKRWAMHLADMYAPDKSKDVLRAFAGKKNEIIESATHVLAYTYHRGPAADERMYVVTKK